MRTTVKDRPIESDEQLVTGARGGDRAAFDELLTRHLHPAWRIAIVTTPEPAAAEAAVVDGFGDAVLAAHRHPDPTFALRERIVATTRRSAIAAPMHTAPATTGEPAVSAFRSLPEAWRSAVWLSDVEGGSPEQVGKVLGLDRAGAAALTDRAAGGFRDRLAADFAARADRPECRLALTKLSALAAGKLTATERGAIESHMAGCGSCAAGLAALVAPRAALRRLVPAVPATLAPAVAAHWTELLERQHRAWLAPWTERAIGAAAAAVLAVGLAGAALLGGGDGTTDGPTNLVAPAVDTVTGESAAATPTALTSPIPTPSAPVAMTRSGLSVPRSGFTGRPTSTSATARPVPAPAPKPAPAPAPTAPTTPSGPSTPVTPAAPVPAPPPGPAPAPPEVPPVAVGIPGVVEVGIGDCTGVNIVGTVVGCDPATTPGPPGLPGLPGLPPLP